MSTPERPTKTDLRRQSPGRRTAVGPQPRETTAAEEAMLLGDADFDSDLASGSDQKKPADEGSELGRRS